MRFSIQPKYHADLRVHRSYEFLEDFYTKVYPKKRRIWVGVAVALILLNLCLIFLR